VQRQKDLRKLLDEVRFAKFFEFFCQQSEKSDTYNALWRGVSSEPHAKLLTTRQNSEALSLIHDPRIILVGEEGEKTASIVFIDPAAVMELVREAQQVYAVSLELLDLLKQRKYDE
jgi:hypothetical protein